MKFSTASTTKDGIIETCELLLDLGDAGISGNSTLLKQFTNLANRSYDNIVGLILKYSGDYNWDDSNYTSFPIATTNLVTTAGSEQSDYTLPTAYDGTAGSNDASSFLRLTGIKILDASGNLQTLQRMTEDHYNQPLETVFKDAGLPKVYRELGNSVRLFPAPLASQVTATAGLRLEFTRDKIDFVSSDTTKQPGFPSIYHYLMPLEMSEAYAAIKGMRQLAFIQQKKAEFTQNLGWGISNRDKNVRQRIIPRSASGQGGWGRNYE